VHEEVDVISVTERPMDWWGRKEVRAVVNGEFEVDEPKYGKSSETSVSL
jgi:hypothetical protein